MIEIRIDFARRRFCLFVNNEAVGPAFTQYKFAVLAKRWLESELA